ncbi:MAG: hypothetical protein COA83_09535 [Methylophaga sp.]|nr:MAG: hypothetical protein COA83_09535 [Methylophaga sp.]
MTSQNLLEVSARLQEAVERITDPPDNAEDIYDRFEMTAIAILDSEHENYPEGDLSRHLEAILSAKRRGLGLEPFGEI